MRAGFLFYTLGSLYKLITNQWNSWLQRFSLLLRQYYMIWWWKIFCEHHYIFLKIISEVQYISSGKALFIKIELYIYINIIIYINRAFPDIIYNQVSNISDIGLVMKLFSCLFVPCFMIYGSFINYYSYLMCKQVMRRSRNHVYFETITLHNINFISEIYFLHIK